MKAVQIQRTGGPEVLQVVDLPVPTPGPGEILVRQEAVGLNYIDTYHRSGLYPVQLPLVLGGEGAGVVEAVGPGVTRFRPGERVGYAGGFGSYAEYRVVAEGRAVRLPDDVSAKTAAAVLLKGMTAEFLLRRCAPVAAGEAVLVHAAAGGVGSILVQWAHALGATVIGSVGSSAKAAQAQADGCAHVILHKVQDVAARVREITGGEGVRVVFDGVGKATFETSLASLGRRGVLVTYGNASGPVPPVDALALMRAGSVYFTRPTLFDYIATTEELDASAAAVFEAVRSGAVKVRVGAERPLVEAEAAHRALEASETSGSTLLIP
ncbi:quinone oxidoreductase [Caulobacter sp. 17J65-9]|uniref:quinone oxidoreductase family protein n=1 Tax=Caulobacter sp. 17J65-9 TaxID=2709382 RepID=UPI0013C9F9F7|nr:quinone oxidoreductase [Caulobacter sp. 17J65-9]NEX93970.1 quinone oxidoreductase [Caulobacter sp. 17J65-9]